jgi:hypothetical protein
MAFSAGRAFQLLDAIELAEIVADWTRKIPQLLMANIIYQLVFPTTSENSPS